MKCPKTPLLRTCKALSFITTLKVSGRGTWYGLIRTCKCLSRRNTHTHTIILHWHQNVRNFTFENICYYSFEVIPGVILPRESAMHKFHTSFSETLTHKPKDNSSCMFLCEFMFSLPYFMQRKVQSVILCMCLLVFSSVFLQINAVFKSIIILSSI